ncbi:hypothetical protein DFH07DRAFT_950870 [Mycena maculata]|uniref:Uncharacterized protein n=1 Tax=Mycena maculata TaxID=230809 RepID=A0AAD7NWC6_9AGAR|nr:hypothetical protein DFH07DRAFT_950870 [Mycena maculata]
MSSKVRSSTSVRSTSGRPRQLHETLNLREVRLAKQEEERSKAERLEALNTSQRHNLDQLQGIADPFDDDDSYEQDVLHGRAAADISHAGEALSSEEADQADAALLTGLRTNHKRLWGRYADTRTWKNRTQQQVDAFRAQLEHMANAYLAFSLTATEGPLPYMSKTPEGAVLEETRDVLVVDMFSASQQDLGLIHGDRGVASACVRHGWMPVAPYFPTVVITIRALEIFRVMRLRCPRLVFSSTFR